MFYISVSDAIYVRLYLQTCQRKKSILNKLAFKKFDFSSYTQVPLSFATLFFLFTLVVVLAALLHPIKMRRLFKKKRLFKFIGCSSSSPSFYS